MPKTFLPLFLQSPTKTILQTLKTYRQQKITRCGILKDRIMLLAIHYDDVIVFKEQIFWKVMKRFLIWVYLCVEMIATRVVFFDKLCRMYAFECVGHGVTETSNKKNTIRRSILETERLSYSWVFFSQSLKIKTIAEVNLTRNYYSYGY